MKSRNKRYASNYAELWNSVRANFPLYLFSPTHLKFQYLYMDVAINRCMKKTIKERERKKTTDQKGHLNGTKLILIYNSIKNH